MSKKEQTLIGNEYVFKKDWDESLSINIEDGLSFGTGKAFFEVIGNHFIARGDADTIEEAEEKAWLRYNTIKNCNHKFKRLNDVGLGECEICHVRGSVLENISTCKCCDSLPLDYVGSDLYCIDHYVEHLNLAIENFDEKKSLSSKNMLLSQKARFEVIIEKGVVNKSSTLEEIERHFKLEKRHIASTIQDYSFELANERFPGKTKEDLALWNKAFEEYDITLQQNKAVIKLVLNRERDDIILSKCREYVF